MLRKALKLVLPVCFIEQQEQKKINRSANTNHTDGDHYLLLTLYT